MARNADRDQPEDTDVAPSRSIAQGYIARLNASTSASVTPRSVTCEEPEQLDRSISTGGEPDLGAPRSRRGPAPKAIGATIRRRAPAGPPQEVEHDGAGHDQRRLPPEPGQREQPGGRERAGPGRRGQAPRTPARRPTARWSRSSSRTPGRGSPRSRAADRGRGARARSARPQAARPSPSRFHAVIRITTELPVPPGRGRAAEAAPAGGGSPAPAPARSRRRCWGGLARRGTRSGRRRSSRPGSASGAKSATTTSPPAPDRPGAMSDTVSQRTDDRRGDGTRRRPVLR